MQILDLPAEVGKIESGGANVAAAAPAMHLITEHRGEAPDRDGRAVVGAEPWQHHDRMWCATRRRRQERSGGKKAGNVEKAPPFHCQERTRRHRSSGGGMPTNSRGMQSLGKLGLPCTPANTIT